MREERARARGFLHADALGGALELVLALLRAEEVAPLLVLAGRVAALRLDAHPADGVVRPPARLLARIHFVSPPRGTRWSACGARDHVPYELHRNPRCASATPHLRTRTRLVRCAQPFREWETGCPSGAA